MSETTAMTIDELIARLENATEGSQDLDDDIAVFLGLMTRTEHPHVFKTPGGTSNGIGPYKHFTRSIDAALTLVPGGWRLPQLVEMEKEDWFVSLWSKSINLRVERAKAATAPLALCIAALKARKQP